MTKADKKKKAGKNYEYLPRWPFWVAVTTFTLGLATMTSQLIILEQNDPHGDEKRIRSAFAVVGLSLTVLITPQINMVNGKSAGIIVSGSY